MNAVQQGAALSDDDELTAGPCGERGLDECSLQAELRYGAAVTYLFPFSVASEMMGVIDVIESTYKRQEYWYAECLLHGPQQ